jgi:3-dehydroquinate dehydratase-2
MAKTSSKTEPKAPRIFVIHGPNLNLLGSRDPEQYGTLTLAKLNSAIKRKGRSWGFEIRIIQSNSEGRIIDLLHRRRKWADAFILNPGAYTHYSYAIRDAIEAIQPPVVEVHLSNIYERENFRRVSVMEDVCLKQFYGKHADSYMDALTFLSEYLAAED